MMKMHLFHGTNLKGSIPLKRYGKNAIKKITYTSKQIEYGNIKKQPGSLGYGFYTFFDNPKVAYDFAHKFISYIDCKDRVFVFELYIEILDENLLVLDGESEDSKNFNMWLQTNKVQKMIKAYKKKYVNAKNNKQKSLDGILIEMYCLVLKKNNINVFAIKAPTRTNIDNEVPYSGVLNGVEILIKDPQIIIDKTFKEYDMGELNYG